jgi:hypothetical protein
VSTTNPLHPRMPDADPGDSIESALTPSELLLADAIVERVAELLRNDAATPTRRKLVDAATVADALGVSRDCVYAHAAELGGERIGSGPRGRLRFDLDRALAAWTARSISKGSQPAKQPAVARGSARRHRKRTGSGPELLPIRGQGSPVDAGQERL